jgi:hypothetical protein
VRLAAPVAVAAKVTGSEVFKGVARNTLYCDVRYCLGNCTPIAIVFYDTTEVAVAFFRTLIHSQKQSKCIMSLFKINHKQIKQG